MGGARLDAGTGRDALARSIVHGQAFGNLMWIGMCSIRPAISKEAAAVLARTVALRLGMQPVHQPVCYDYPLEKKGGNGFTYILPITESFVSIDMYPENHGGYMIISSCVEVDMKDWIRFIREQGYEVGGHAVSMLHL